MSQMKTSVLDFNLIDPVEAGEEWAVAFDSPYNVVEIYIDKVEIRDIVRPLEEAYMKESEPSLLRMGHEQYYSHLWPKLLYDNLHYARMRDPYFENDDCLLLGCVECGIPECWSFSIKVREDEKYIYWYDFEHLYREWEYGLIFRFEKRQYEAAMRKLHKFISQQMR